MICWPGGWGGRTPHISRPQTCLGLTQTDGMYKAEPIFANLLRSPGIDSQPGGPVRQPHLSYWPARLHRLSESIPRNRFLDSLNVYKYELWLLRVAMRNVIFRFPRVCKNITEQPETEKPEAEFLDVYGTKVLRVFSLLFTVTSTEVQYKMQPLAVSLGNRRFIFPD